MDVRRRIFEEMDSAHVEAGRAERRCLRAILECDRADVWKGHGARDHAEFLAGRYGFSKWKARRMIAAAYTLESLPLTSHALETGVLNIDKVIELTRFAVPADEKKLIAWAKRVSAACIRARADEETHRPLKDVQHNEAERGLSWYSHELGLQIEGRLTHEAGAAFTAAIDKLASDLPDLPIGADMVVDPKRTLEQRRADALVLLCTQDGNGNGTARPTVVVHAPLEAMTVGTKNARSEDGSVLHPATAQRLACDGHIDVVLYDHDRVVDMGRSSREPSPQLRRQVLKRDSSMCQFTGCGQKRFVQVHHMDPWVPRGVTKLDNLITLCSTHHRLVHEQGWGVCLKDDGTPQWFTPGGRVFEPGPAPPAGEPPPEPSFDPRPWGQLWHWLQDVGPGYPGDAATRHFLRIGARRLTSNDGRQLPLGEKGRGRMPVCERPTSSTRSERPWGGSGERSRTCDRTTSQPMPSAAS